MLMMQSLIGTYYHHSGGFGKTSNDWFLVIPGEIRTLLMSIFSICLMLAQWENAEWRHYFLSDVTIRIKKKWRTKRIPEKAMDTRPFNKWHMMSVTECLICV